MSQLSYYQLNSQDKFSDWNYLSLLLDVLSVFAFEVPSLSLRCQFVLKTLTSVIFVFTILGILDAKQNKTKPNPCTFIIKEHLGIIIAIMALGDLPRKGIRNQIQ